MGPVLDLLASNVDIAALAVLAILFPFFIWLTLRARQGYAATLRSIPLYERVHQLTSQAAESGRPVHLALGSGALGSELTPEALMGLTVLNYVARHSAVYDQHARVTVGDATLLPLAQGVLQNAFSEAGFPEHYAGRDVRFYGQDRLAFAAGAADTLEQDDYLGALTFGPLQSEGLWLSEKSGRDDTLWLGGAAEPSASALLRISMDETLVGEDVFAAGAYLERPNHLGSLAAQDLLRGIVILAMLAGAVLTSLGYWSL